MRTALAALTPCLLLLLAAAFPSERRDKLRYAARDDVTILGHGLLQLGQNLKEHVDKTKAQMRDVLGQLRAFNRSLAELGREGQRLGAAARGAQDREAQLLNVTAELRERLEEVQQERRTMGQRMSRLEQRVDSLLQEQPGCKNGSDPRSLQLLLDTQSRRVDELLERVRLQQDKLDKQNLRLRTLQSQMQQAGPRPSPRVGGAGEQRDSPRETPTDCHELFLRGETSSGVYTVQPLHSRPFNVFCEMTADGGWTVVQRRQDGSVDFDQLWQAYENGFGSLSGEFWLGLENIHTIAKDGSYVLNIRFSDWGEDSASVRFPFELGGKETNYSLLAQPTGADDTLESSLTSDSALALSFSTRDQDNDRKADTNCAKQLSGGWWFSNCGRSNLNGRYFQSPPPKQRHQRKQGIFWKTWRGRYYPLKSSVMMIAPAAINKS